jgi:hypothetical protein
MKLKAATEKSTSQQQPKSLKAYEFCASPQQQKNKSTKNQKK